MYVIIWEYRINTEHRKSFIDYYKSDGDWAKFFRQGENYISTEFFQSEKDSSVYITIDKWASKESYEHFCGVHHALYEKMDKLCERFTSEEKLIGKYTTERFI